MAAASSTSRRTCASTLLACAGRAPEPRRRPGRTEGREGDRARRLRLDRVHRSCRLRRCRRLPAIFPAGRRLARTLPLLRRQRHAPGEHDRGGRASGADRSGNDPAGDRREHKTEEIEAQAFEAAMEIIDNSVMMVGLLPAYGRSPDNNIFAMGGMNSDWNSAATCRGTTSIPTICGPQRQRQPAGRRCTVDGESRPVGRSWSW